MKFVTIAVAVVGLAVFAKVVRHSRHHLNGGRR